MSAAHPHLSLRLPRLRPPSDPGTAIGRVVRGALVITVLLLAGLGGVMVVGFITSGGGQPAQLGPQPSPSIDLMPMGNAHIPTANACVLCHGAGGEVKSPLPMLHPVEGWRRCLVCHTNDALGRTAPGHEGIAETECLNCHKTAQAGPAITQPHAALHDQHCLDCHGSVAHLPSTMASTEESGCVLCHKPTALPPPSYPHAADAIVSCRVCHQSAEVGALPIDHALRDDSTCLLCHDIKSTGPVPGVTPTPPVSLPPLPTPSG